MYCVNILFEQTSDIPSCHKTDELHDKRHREILDLVIKVRKCDGLIDGVNPSSNRKKKTRKLSLPHGVVISDRNLELVDGKLEQWQASRRHKRITPDSDDEHEEQGLEKWNDSSTSDEDEPGHRKSSNAKFHTASGEKKIAKAERKRAKHQSEVEIMTEKDLQQLHLAIHPAQSLIAEQKRWDASQGLAQNPAIEENIAFNTHTYNYSLLRTTFHGKKAWRAKHFLCSKEEPQALMEKKAIVESVLQAMCPNSGLTRATKELRALNVKLREAICEDLVAVANEQAETMERMAGYWRYANRRTYNAMVRMNEIWDW